MHSIPISAPISAAAAGAVGWSVRSYARANGRSEKQARAMGSAAGALARAGVAHTVSLMLLDSLGGHVAAAPHTVQFARHLVTLTMQQAQVPVIQVS